MSATKLTAVAYYLGQYHPTKENDEFWGAGFTEWHNVAKARPLFPGHAQPKLPGALGFYDLRCEETLEAQLELAASIGIDAFCFWHYWFAGRRVLDGPLHRMLEMKRAGLKFMLGWANESWSGAWHGLTSRILIEQTYNRDELDAHARVIAEYIASGNYLEIGGRFPVVIYKPRQIPNAADYLGELKSKVEKFSGAKLYLIANWSPGRSFAFADPREYGCDAAVITPVAAYFRSAAMQNAYSAAWQTLRGFGVGPEVRNYAQVSVTLERAKATISGAAHATVVTGWDNTPRSGRRGLVLRNYTARTFRDAAVRAVELERQNETPLLFIKSWNEWAEGNTIEPLFNESWSAAEIMREVLNRGK